MKLNIKRKPLPGEIIVKERFAFIPTVLSFWDNTRQLVWFEKYYRVYSYGTAYGTIYHDFLNPITSEEYLKKL